MIFYKLLEISTNFVKIEFSPSFEIGQNIQIIDFENWLQNINKNENQNNKLDYKNLLSKNKENTLILGKIIQINSEFVLIKTFETLANLKIDNLVVQVLENKKILSFSPTLLGRTWSNFEFLETFWQEEEKAGKLLGSRLLTGKIVEYGQNSPNWQNNSQNQNNKWQNQRSQLIKTLKNKNNQKIKLNLTFTNPIFEEIFHFPFEVKIGNWNYFGQNSRVYSIANQNSTNSNNLFNSQKINPKLDLINTLLQIIEQTKSNFDQPIFLIMTRSLSLLQLKDFYFKLLEGENLFNSFVIDFRFCQTIFGETWEFADFLNQNLEKKVFVIMENISQDSSQNQNIEINQNISQNKNQNKNSNITFIQIEN